MFACGFVGNSVDQFVFMVVCGFPIQLLFTTGSMSRPRRFRGLISNWASDLSCERPSSSEKLLRYVLGRL